jgi:hypothetical protein
VTGVIGAIAEREKVTPDMVLLAWAKAKGAVVITYVLYSCLLQLLHADRMIRAQHELEA